MESRDFDPFLEELPEQVRTELLQWIESARAGELASVTASLAGLVSKLRKTFEAAVTAVRKEIEQ